MATASNQAALNHASSSVMPDTPPSSTKACPYMKPLRLGVFFDGTGNNKYTAVQEGGDITNVVRLLNVYKGTSDGDKVRDKLYLIGVGAGDVPKGAKDEWTGLQSDSGTGLLGAAFGKGMKDRLVRAYNWVKGKVQAHSDEYTLDSEKLVDIYGFSRGAALARTFDNLIVQALIKEPKTRNSRVRFLGVFDTVASTGLPGKGVGLNLGLKPGDFYGAYHCTARNEVRANFPLSLLECNDVEYAGVHSDIGGGYADGYQGRRNWLAGPPLWDMYTRSHNEQKVEYTGPPTLPGGMSLADVTRLKTEGDEYDGHGAENTSPAAKKWMSTYVHDSTEKVYKGNWARTVDDTSKGPIGYDPESGMPIYPQIRKREILRERRRKLTAMPPNFSWD